MRIFITGGAGFIGSAVTLLAVERGFDCLVVDKLTYAGNLANLRDVSANAHFRFLEADICDEAAMANAMAAFRPTAVMHLAAESHVDRSIASAAEFVRTNVFGTYTLLETARRYWENLGAPEKAAFRFLHISTDEVYGSLGPDGLFDETTAYDPRSPYAASKASSDHFVQAWRHTYGLPTLISNCSNNYGPRHLPEKLIPLVLLNALEGKPLPVYGNGSNVRDWLYVDDHARALLLILERGVVGEKYNVGGRNERTNLQVVQTLCDLLDEMAPTSGPPRRDLITFVKDRPGHDQRYAIDATKLETELGWRAEESFETGLRKTIAWYLANRSWWEPLRAAGHGADRLGLVAGKAAP